MTEPALELKSAYKGHPYVVLFMPGCYRCGYVGIPKGEKIDIGSINCHGGITYSEDYLFSVEDEGHSWIGFDCAHCFDGYDIETAKEYFEKDTQWQRTYGAMEEFYKDMNKDYSFATLKYVADECIKIIDQIE